MRKLLFTLVALVGLTASAQDHKIVGQFKDVRLGYEIESNKSVDWIGVDQFRETLVIWMPWGKILIHNATEFIVKDGTKTWVLISEHDDYIYYEKYELFKDSRSFLILKYSRWAEWKDSSSEPTKHVTYLELQQ